MFYPPPCSIRHGPSTISRARWRAGTQVCGSTVLTTQAYSTSHPTSLRSTTAFAPTAVRTDPFVATPGSCPWSSSASQWHGRVADSIVSMLFVSYFSYNVFLPHLECFGVSAGRTGTSLLQKCLPALQWSSACCPKRRPAGGRSRWPSVRKVRHTLCGQTNANLDRLSFWVAGRDKWRIGKKKKDSWLNFNTNLMWLAWYTENIQPHIN